MASPPTVPGDCDCFVLSQILSRSLSILNPDDNPYAAPANAEDGSGPRIENSKRNLGRETIGTVVSMMLVIGDVISSNRLTSLKLWTP
jgi:hypothetical protein